VIVRDFNLFCPCICPDKANAILVIDPNAVLSLSVACKCLQLIAWRHSKVTQRVSKVELVKLPPGDVPDALRTSPDERLFVFSPLKCLQCQRS